MDSCERRISEFWDRELIRDCLYRYCRGIDRADELSALYDDARAWLEA